MTKPIHIKVILIWIISYIIISPQAFSQKWQENDSIRQVYIDKGNLNEALRYGEETLRLVEIEFGKDNMHYANMADSLLEIHMYLGNYDAAIQLAEEELTIREGLQRKTYPDYANALVNLELLYIMKGDFNKAFDLIEIVMGILESNYDTLHPDYLTAKNNQAACFLTFGDYKVAEKMMLQVLETRKKVLDVNNIDFAESYGNLGLLYFYLGKYSKAKEYNNKALGILKNCNKEFHPNYLMIESNLAVVYSEVGENENARILLESVLKKRKASLGATHLDIALNLNNLGLLYYKNGQYNEAEKLYKEALEMVVKIAGKGHPYYLQFLSNLGILYDDKAEYDKAEKIGIEVLKLTDSIYGDNHTIYANMLNNMGMIQLRQGKYIEALDFFNQAIVIYQEKTEETNLQYLSVLNNKAVVYVKLDLNEKAISIYETARSIFKQNKLEYSPTYYTLIDNLAQLYYSLGMLGEAEVLFHESVEVRKLLLGDSHMDYAHSLQNLGLFYYEIGQTDKADELIIRSGEILRNTVSEEHPAYIAYLGIVASRLSDFKDYVNAEEMYIQALNNIQKSKGFNHPDYANTLASLASLYIEIEDYKNAEQIILEVLRIEEDIYGEYSHEYASTLSILSELYEDMDNLNFAVETYKRAYNINDKIFKNNTYNIGIYAFRMAILYYKKMDYHNAKQDFSIAISNINNYLTDNLYFLSEAEKTSYYNSERYKFDIFYSFSLKNKILFKDLGMTVYDNILNNKGILLNSERSINNSVLNNKDENITNTYNKLKIVRSHLSKLYLQPITERKVDTDSLEAMKNKLEKELIQNSNEYRKIHEKEIISTKEIKDLLKPNEAAIEFISFDYYDKRWTDSTFYCALVLRKDYEYPKMVYLFEEKQLQNAISSSADFNPAKLIMNLYGQSRGATILVRDGNTSYGSALYNLVWKPLDSLLDGIGKIYYSPSGLLHNISFAAIPTSDSTLICDNYDISLMSTTANIVLNEKPGMNNLEAAIYGGITYDMTQQEMLSNTKKYNKDKVEELLVYNRGHRYNDTIRGGSWNYLKGTLIEAQNVSSTLNIANINTTIYIGVTANEESFKALSGRNSPQIIHLATHGFFFPDPEKKEKKKNIGVQRFEEPIFSFADNPLIRSGLILAGGNVTWNGEIMPVEVEDGILTAYEVSGLDLFNTQLVTLSACETGLGDIQGTEGVYGLQRAFKMAGVDYLIMSLWQVPDKETQEFMELFYSNWTGGQAIGDAFRSTQRTMRNKYEPYYWAGFVLME